MLAKTRKYLRDQGPLFGKDKDIATIRREKLTYLDYPAMADIRAAVERLESEGIEGSILEAGCALGGSAVLMAKAKNPARALQVYDVFGMIPPPGENDDQDVHDRYQTIVEGDSKGIAGDTYYGYAKDLYTKVSDAFQRNGVPAAAHNVELIKGLFEDTLHPSGPVALAHIDCDWYDSVMVCLERIAPHMPKGGRFIMDDVGFWSGADNAVDDFLQGRTDFKREQHARLHLVKR